MPATSLPVVPPALSPGSRIRIVAPSGPFDRALVLRGIAFLASRYRVEFDWSIFSRHQMFAGSDERRQKELDAALSDPNVAAIVAARGGYGLTRILPRAPLQRLRESPRWVVGFSDITALHVEAMRLGIVSLHAPNVAGLGRGDAHARRAWISALETPYRRQEFANLNTWYPGVATGPLVGGNLTMLFTCAAAGRLDLPDGAVLIVEDVAEISYRIDRMLTALVSSGALSRVAAVIVGEFTDCPAGRFGSAADEIVRDRLSRLAVPIVSGLPFGHGHVNVPIPLGRPATVDGTQGTVIVNSRLHGERVRCARD